MKRKVSPPGRRTSNVIQELLVAVRLKFRILKINHSGVSMSWTVEKPRAGLLELSPSSKVFSLILKSFTKLGSIT